MQVSIRSSSQRIPSPLQAVFTGRPSRKTLLARIVLATLPLLASPHAWAQGWNIIMSAVSGPPPVVLDSYGRFYAGGITGFPDGSGVYVFATTTNTPAKGALLSSVVSSGHTIDTSTFTVTDNSALFNFDVILNASSIDLLTTSASSTGSGVYEATLHQSFNQGLGAARVLDGFVNGSNTGDLVNVVDALGKLGSEQAVSNAVAQTLPVMSASMNQVAMSSMQNTNRTIQARQEGKSGFSTGEAFLGDNYFWFKPIAARADQDNHNGVAGYKADTYGMIFGADADISERTRLGLAFSYMNSNVDGKSTASTNSADIDAFQLVGYGSHSLSSNPDIELSWQADAGVNKNDGQRKINFGGLSRVAKSDYDSTTAHLGAGIGRRFQLNERTAFIPALRADYYWIRSEAYTEKGADALNLHVKSADSEQLIATVEGKLHHQLTDRAALNINAGLGYDLLNDESSITASYVGGGAAFRTPGLALSPWLARAGFGLTVNATDRIDISARYDLEGRSDYLGQTASLKIRFAF